MLKPKFYIALQGNLQPHEYISLARTIEELGFDRVYVYDDLLYYPSFPILALIAEHTHKIEVGPCLVNGLYRHPAILAANFTFLDALSNGRAVLGLGRGAFFEHLKINTSEKFTRKVYSETVRMVSHFLHGIRKDFSGNVFKSTEAAFLRMPLPDNPKLVTATWNTKMAYLAGKYSHELQLAEVFTNEYFKELEAAYLKGFKESSNPGRPKISIGGMTCLAEDRGLAYQKAKQTLAIYAPYLKTILKRHGVDVRSRAFTNMEQMSRRGDLENAARQIPDSLVDMLTLSGTPQEVAGKIVSIIGDRSVEGILFSPPYGAHDSITKNLEFIARELFPKIIDAEYNNRFIVY